jgi:ribosomal protein S18 acetylase RimI-like enzyme
VDNKVIGFICFIINADPKLGTYIDNLHVDMTQQSKGTGKALLTHAAMWINKHSSSSSMFLLVTQNNGNAQKFYARFGGENKALKSWTAPDGTIVPTYQFVWASFDKLI